MLRKINPLHLLALILILCFLSFIILFFKENKLTKTFIEKNNISLIANNFSQLQNKWANPKNNKKKITNFLKTHHLNTNSEVFVSSNIVKLSFKNTNEKKINEILTYFLNNNFFILDINLEENILEFKVKLK